MLHIVLLSIKATTDDATIRPKFLNGSVDRDTKANQINSILESFLFPVLSYPVLTVALYLLFN